MTMTGPSLLMTMSDIAGLARVQRPVVSMWRSRTANSDACGDLGQWALLK
jgi:hypothetical protein